MTALPPTNGVEIIQGLANHDYHALLSISKSGLDLIHRAPALYQFRRENPAPPTPAMRMGTLTHLAILEPDQLTLQCVVVPEVNRRTNAGKAEWEAFCLANEGKEVVTLEEMDTLMAMRDAAHKHPAAGRALSLIREIETSILFPAGGVDCRCRPDAILTNGLILDLKTTKDARPDEFAKSIANYRYHVQAAFYADGYQAAFGEAPKGFAFLAIETEPPYLCAVYVASAEMILRGRADYERDLATYAECIRTDCWPGLPDSPLKLDLPKWA